MRSTGTGANVPLRGVGERGPELREDFRIVAGRMFRRGQNEVIVGRGAFSQFENIDLGREVKWGSQTWRVVGVFEAGGSVSESEVWTDAVVLRGDLSARQHRADRARPAHVARGAADGSSGPRARSPAQRVRCAASRRSIPTSRASCSR